MTNSSESFSSQRSNTYRYIVGGIIVLMIVLMLFPINLTGRSQRGADADSPLFGVTKDNVRVTVADRTRATQLLETLHRIYVQAGSTQGRLDEVCWGPDVVAGFRKSPEALHLSLLAAKSGPGASPLALGPLDADERSTQDTGIFNSGFVWAEQLLPLPGSPLANALQQQPGPMLAAVQLVNPAERGLEKIASLSPAEQNVVFAALRDFLSLQSAALLEASAVKVSTPIADRLIAERLQRVTVRVADFDAVKRLDGVPEPSDAELQAQFAAYADVAPGSATAENPFGFGYRLPDRVKVEWLAIDRAAVRAAVEAEKSPYEWDVDTRIAYKNDPAAFASATRPAATQSATRPATTNPSFDSFKAEAIRLQIDAATDARMAEIERRARAILSSDYQSWLANQPSKSEASTAPSGSIAAPDYLDRVAEQVARQAKVRPTVERLTDAFRGQSDLESATSTFATFAHITGAEARNSAVPGYETAATYATRAASTRPSDGSSAETIKPFQPSATVSDALDSRRAIFRVTAVDPSHPAPDLAAVREQVRADVRIQQAFAKAAAEAKQVADLWRSGGATPAVELKTAVLDRGNASSNALELSGPPLEQFYDRGLDTLLAAGAGEHPISSIEVPLARRVFVARREEVTPVWTTKDELTTLRPDARAFAARQMLEPRSPGNLLGLSDAGALARLFDAQRILADRGWQPAAESR